MIDRLLKAHLEPIARDQRRWRLLGALTRGWLIAAAIALAFMAVRFLTGWYSPWSFVVLLGGTLLWTVWAGVRFRRNRPDYRAIARQIELENPRLHALLLTAVEQSPDPATGRLNYLQERVVQEALSQDRPRDWHARTKQQLGFARLAGFGAFILLIGALAGLYQPAPPGMTFFENLITHGVIVTPGDTSVEKGSSLVVLARFHGKVPAQAHLVVRPANEPEQRIPLAKNLDDPVFGASLPQINGPLTYRVEFGSETTREFAVTTFEHPRLERADARLTFPDYTGLPVKAIQDTRRISAVEGSTLDYTFYLNKPVRSATLGARDGNSLRLVADPAQANVLRLNLKLDASRRYELVLVDDAGRTNKVPPQFVFEVLTNRAPELKFAFPRGDQRVSALEEIVFRGEVSDDFGLTAYGFAYNLAGQETKFVELGQAAGAHEKRPFDYVVPLEELGAEPDQLLSYYLWADDIGPEGTARRTAGDMFFAEVRPFDEIFREGQSADGGEQQQQQRQQRQGAAERLAELQKQIINATWNLQRRETGRSPSPKYREDAAVIQESQENALEQVRAARERTDDPRSDALLESVEKEMLRAASLLGSAAGDNSIAPLPLALAAEQSAYQGLLRQAAREYQVARSQNSRGSQGSRGQRAQRQLDQLELKQSENRYQTQRQAALPQDPQQREQLQAFNRLKELAQRQQDVNERLKELQAALQEAKSEPEREELQRQLKRLEEEQRQMLADLDELRQRMERPENQSQMAEARQQLDQTRADLQRAAESLERGEIPQALSSGTRAQRELQEMRDDFRRRNSSQFAEGMRELRNQARELAQKQEEVGEKLESLTGPAERKTLTDSDERKELASQLEEQKARLDDLVKNATEMTQQAEAVEPLLSRQLYDTLRKAAQDDARNLQETTEDLLSRGRMYRDVYERLRSGRDGSRRAVEVAAELLRDGFAAEANELEQRARHSINELRSGVERAAESVLGDDTEALRLARGELEELADQVEREMAQAQGRGEQGRGEQGRGEQGRGEQGRGEQGRGEQGRGEQESQNRASAERSSSSPESERSTRSRAAGSTGPSAQNFLEEFTRRERAGPLTGSQYSQWSDRLRDVEEMLDLPELRSDAARIRDRARSVRINLTRHSLEPQWDMVRNEIAGPLRELRTRIHEELARRESREALVPIDRDPVPSRYSELVRRYYEQLGRSESPDSTGAVEQ